MRAELLVGAQAAGADIEPFLLAFYQQLGRVNIDLPAPPRMALGVAHIMAVLRRFTTKLTFGSQVVPL